MLTIITAVFYFIPAIYSLIKNPISCRSVFFVYTTLGAWLYCFFLEFGFLGGEHLIANWVLTFDDVPWVEFSLLNFLIFIFSRPLNGRVFNRPGLAKASINLNVVFYIAFSSVLLESLLVYEVYDGINNFIKASYSRVAVDDSRVNFIFPLVILSNILVTFLFASIKGALLSKKGFFFYISLVLYQFLFTLLAGGRSLALLLLLGFIIIHYKKFRNIGLFKSMLILTCVVLASGYMIYKRLETQEATTSFELNTSSVIEASYTGLPMIDHLGLSKLYVEQEGYDFGEVYLNALMSFIPRSIWKEKPIQLSRKVRLVFWGDDKGGIPPGIFGEAYISFGVIGLLMVSLLFARLLLITDIYINKSKLELINLVRKAIFPTSVGFILVRGGVDIGIFRVGMIVFFYILIERYLLSRNVIGIKND